MYEVVERTLLAMACIARERAGEMFWCSFLGERSGELSKSEIMKVFARLGPS